MHKLCLLTQKRGFGWQRYLIKNNKLLRLITTIFTVPILTGNTSPVRDRNRLWIKDCTAKAAKYLKLTL